jgi:hypothetical protein
MNLSKTIKQSRKHRLTVDQAIDRIIAWLDYWIFIPVFGPCGRGTVQRSAWSDLSRIWKHNLLTAFNHWNQGGEFDE